MQVRFLIAIAVILLSCVGVAAEKPDFSGEWIVNRDSSRVDDMGYMFLPVKLAIKQEQNDFMITRTFEGQSGEEFMDDEKLTLDGKECKSLVMNSDRTSTAIWSEDGKILKINTKIAFDQGDVTGEWLMRLKSEDLLSVKYNVSSGFGDRSLLLVFTKAEK